MVYEGRGFTDGKNSRKLSEDRKRQRDAICGIIRTNFVSDEMSCRKRGYHLIRTYEKEHERKDIKVGQDLAG